LLSCAKVTDNFSTLQSLMLREIQYRIHALTNMAWQSSVLHYDTMYDAVASTVYNNKMYCYLCSDEISNSGSKLGGGVRWLRFFDHLSKIEFLWSKWSSQFWLWPSPKFQKFHGQNGQSKFDQNNLYNSRIYCCWNLLKLLKYLLILTIWSWPFDDKMVLLSWSKWSFWPLTIWEIRSFYGHGHGRTPLPPKLLNTE
jgi:hypothetical protein